MDNLTWTEARIMKLLGERPEGVPRDEIMAFSGITGKNSLNVHISRLREKLRDGATIENISPRPMPGRFVLREASDAAQ